VSSGLQLRRPATERGVGLRAGLGGAMVLLGAVGGAARAVGLEGDWVVGVSGALVVVGAILALWEKILDPLLAARVRSDARLYELRSILQVDPDAVDRIDPYGIGVFPSELAARVAGSERPPYVARGIDEALCEAFSASSLARTQRLVVVRGEPKCGKSRTLWQATRQVAGNRVLFALTKRCRSSAACIRR
jgi:hypothetical protein